MTFLSGNTFAFAPHAYNHMLVFMPLKTAASSGRYLKIPDMKLGGLSLIAD